MCTSSVNIGQIINKVSNLPSGASTKEEFNGPGSTMGSTIKTNRIYH